MNLDSQDKELSLLFIQSLIRVVNGFVDSFKADQTASLHGNVIDTLSSDISVALQGLDGFDDDENVTQMKKKLRDAMKQLEAFKKKAEAKEKDRKDATKDDTMEGASCIPSMQSLKLTDDNNVLEQEIQDGQATSFQADSK